MRKTFLFCVLMGLLTIAFPQKKDDLLNQISQLETELNLLKESNAATLTANQQANKLMEDRLAVQDQQINNYRAETDRLSSQLNALISQNNQYRQQIDSLTFQLLNAKSTPVAEGKAYLKTFTNATASFTVPAGKTWYVYNVCPTLSTYNGNNVALHLKSLNGITTGKSSLEQIGLIIQRNGMGNKPSFPLILPESTTIEFEVYTYEYNSSSNKDEYIRLDIPAFINYIEYDNLP